MPNDLTTMIAMAVKCLARHPHHNEEQMALALIHAGIPEVQASEMVTWIPLAFGRMVLDQLGVEYSDHYILMDPDTGMQERRPLAQQQSFQAARYYAANAVTGLSEAGGEAIFRQSAEVDSVINAMSAGELPEDLVLGEPVIMATVKADPPPPAASQAPPPAASQAPPPAASQEKRPWWRLW
jgi:hypothetical protein